MSSSGSRCPRTRTTGCAPTVTCRSDAFRATICSSRSSMEYSVRRHSPPRELSAAAYPILERTFRSGFEAVRFTSSREKSCARPADTTCEPSAHPYQEDHACFPELRTGSVRRGARGLHPDRAPGRDHHPRDPACDRDPVVPQLPHPGEQVGRAGERPRSRPGHGGVQRRPRHRLRGRHADQAPAESYDAGIKNIKISVATLDELLHPEHRPGHGRRTTSPARPATSRPGNC